MLFLLLFSCRFIDNVCEDGICLVILTATSNIGEETARFVPLELLNYHKSYKLTELKYNMLVER